MRLNEIAGPFDEHVPDNREERAELLRQKIERGERPFIAAASSVKGSFAWGDLERLGWATKHRRVISSRDALVEEWWEYTGPGTVMVQPYFGHPATPFQAGDTTDTIEIDYS